jgi:hypothetical protein
MIRPRRRSSLWMYAAIGGLIGCALLTVVVIALAVLSNGPQPGVNIGGTFAPDQSINSTALPTLDPTSDAAARALRGETQQPDNAR